MPITDEILAIESEAYTTGKRHTLAQAYDLLLHTWLNGNRDRDVGLHLMFLSWYGLVEPDFITGFEQSDEVMASLESTFNEVYRFFEPLIKNDPEMLYVVGLMAQLFPWVLGDVHEWEKIGNLYQELYRSFWPNGPDPKVFDNQGAYGDYFGGQASVQGGY